MRFSDSPRSFLASLVMSAALVACGGAGSSSSTTTSTTGTSSADEDASCPVAVPGTSVDVEDTDTGAALVFVTTGDVDELRRRVASMAAMHNDHHGKMGALPTGDEPGGGHEGHDMSGHDMGGEGGGGEHAGHAGGMIGVHSSATVENIDGGAKIAFVSGGTDVAQLQDELRMHATHFASGSCAMDSH